MCLLRLELVCVQPCADSLLSLTFVHVLWHVDFIRSLVSDSVYLDCVVVAAT